MPLTKVNTKTAHASTGEAVEFTYAHSSLDGRTMGIQVVSFTVPIPDSSHYLQRSKSHYSLVVTKSSVEM